MATRHGSCGLRGEGGLRPTSDAAEDAVAGGAGASVAVGASGADGDVAYGRDADAYRDEDVSVVRPVEHHARLRRCCLHRVLETQSCPCWADLLSRSVLTYS